MKKINDILVLLIVLTISLIGIPNVKAEDYNQLTKAGRYGNITATGDKYVNGISKMALNFIPEA